MLQFDEETHTYTLAGRTVPSVTQILSFGEDLSRIPAWTAERGKAVHLAAQFDDEGDLDEESLDPIVRPYLDAYRRWRVKCAPRFLGIELMVWGEHDGLQFCGTIDRVALIEDRLAVLDLKTGSPRPEHAAQVAAYAVAYTQQHDGQCPEHQGCIYLGRDGSYDVRTYDDGAGWEYFVDKLRAYYAATREGVK